MQGRPQTSIYPDDTWEPEHGPLTGALHGIELIKSHELRPEFEELVYLVRDGRNAMISYLYMQFLFKGHRYERTEEIYEGIRFLTEKGDFWGDHLREARAFFAGRRVCLVRHEDLVRDPLTTLCTITQFMGVQVPDSTVRLGIEAVARSTRYRANYFNGFTYRPAPGSIYELLQRHRSGDYWRMILDVPSRRYFHERGGTEFLLQFGYERSAGWWAGEPAPVPAPPRARLLPWRRNR